MKSDYIINIGRYVIRKIMKIQPILYGARHLAKYNMIPRSIWNKLPVDTDFTITINKTNFIYASSAYDSIGRLIFWAGEEQWEYESTSVFSTIANKAKLILDIGANTGIYTLISLASNPDSHVIAFEPAPKLRDHLRHNIETNSWSNRCTIKQNAVADTPGHTKFHIPDLPMPTTGSLHTSGFRGLKGKLIDVEVVTADQVISSDQVVDLVKMDIEGFEDKALKGMTRILKDDQPIILLECNPDGPAHEIETILKNYNYNFFHLRDNGLLQITGIQPDDNCKFRNFLCVPTSKLDWIKTLTLCEQCPTSNNP